MIIIVSKYFYCLQQLEKYMEDLNESNFKMQDLKTSLLRISSKGLYKDKQKIWTMKEKSNNCN